MTATPFSIPSSSIGLPISGSRTLWSAVRTSSSVTIEPRLSCFRRCVSVEPGGELVAAKGNEVHKALADDTRFRLYRYLRLSDRAVSVSDMARRLSLHPNTLRPHLRQLEDAGLVSH